MTENKKEWDTCEEGREWAAAATETACQKIAKRKGKRLVEIIDTKNNPLRFICILEDYPDE
jgi:hypothetical protein